MSPMSTSNPRRVVIGLGNPLMGDDGLGIAVLEQLRVRGDVPPDVELIDGGTWGMNLLPVIEDAGELILIDAIDVGAPPGTLVRLTREQLPRYLAAKISPHEVDLRDVLALAELRGTLPPRTVAIGLQPAEVTLRNALSDLLRCRLTELAVAVMDELERSQAAPVHA